MKNKLNIAVVYGGTSSEREVSIMTGQNVKEALINKGHHVTLIDPKNKKDLIKLINENFDIAYNALHGKGGEDGTMQGFFETIKIPYTGSGILSSAIGINKAYTKHIYNLCKIPTSPSVTIYKNEEYSVKDIIKKIGNHVVIKAAEEGSSIGLFITKGIDNITKAIDKALEIDNIVIVEKYIKGNEFTCAAIKLSDKAMRDWKFCETKNNIVALPVIQIIPKNSFYDFESKYKKGGSDHICPAQIPKKLTSLIQKYTTLAYESLGCLGFARTDFIVDSDGNPWALETNTLPGMTATSLVPDSAKSIGISFEDLCELLVDEAITVK